MPDPIFNYLISIGYTNITKHYIPPTDRIITPQIPTNTTENILPTMTPFPETTLFLIAEPTDSTTTLLTYHHLTKQIYTYSPSTSTLALSSPTTNLALRRRYVAVQKARDAGTVGIIVGTLGKGGYLSLISLLRKMVLERGKKPYLLALGKLNPAKVANFAECDIFCIIACPESTVIDSRVFPTLFEIDLGIFQTNRDAV
jgi:diphthamide biosynthesis protein 2